MKGAAAELENMDKWDERREFVYTNAMATSNFEAATNLTKFRGERRKKRGERRGTLWDSGYNERSEMEGSREEGAQGWGCFIKEDEMWPTPLTNKMESSK